MTDCIESTRTPSQRQPQVWHAGRPRLETRVVWEQAFGPIPEGLLVCHHCDNSRCIRLDHLYLGTQRDNMQDRLRRDRNPNTLKTHCPRGHEYTPENTTRGKGSQGRKCKECRRGSKV